MNFSENGSEARQEKKSQIKITRVHTLYIRGMRAGVSTVLGRVACTMDLDKPKRKIESVGVAHI